MKGFNHLFAGVLAGHSSTQSLTGKPVLAAQDIVPGIVPSAPGPGDVFREGGKCTLSWTPDPAGLWKETNVELMSGDNWNMVHITSERPPMSHERSRPVLMFVPSSYHVL